MDEITKWHLIFKISLIVGLPAIAGVWADSLVKNGNLNDFKSIILFIIGACSGLLWLGRGFLKFLRDLMDTDKKYTEYKDNKEDHKHRNHEEKS